MKTTIRFTSEQVDILQRHLFPGDGKEAVALVLCGRRSSSEQDILCAYKILPIPYASCYERTSVNVHWPTSYGRDIFKVAMQKGMAILKIHSHTGEYRQFSPIDDESDRELFASLHAWTDDGLPHASAIMMPDKSIIGRIITADLNFKSVDRIAVIGDNIDIFDDDPMDIKMTAIDLRNHQAFGEKTMKKLRMMEIGIVGCSGTGSWVVEQLARLGVGRLVLVDPDVVEHKNLNRIINSTWDHAERGTSKVEIFREAVNRIGFGTNITTFQEDVFSEKVLKRLANCDVLFGCSDSIDSRHFLNRLATFYTIPYFDLGVSLVADGKGGVDTVCGSVHYLIPGGSSLLSRELYTTEMLRVAILRKTNPDQYKEELREGYIKGIAVESPAVISINGFCATLAVNNFLARLHPFCIESTSTIRYHCFDLVNWSLVSYPDGDPCPELSQYVGAADSTPFLNCIIS